MIATFTRFDLMSWFPRKQTVLMLVFVAAIAVALPIPGLAVVAAGLMTSVVMTTPFLGDERGRLDTLYGVLPVSRAAVVAGRALSLVVFYLVAAVVATLATVVAATVRGNVVPTELLLVTHPVAFAVVGLAMALQLPVLFRIGFTRGRFIAYAPAAVLAAGAWVAQATGVTTAIGDGAAGIPLGLVVGAGVLLGALGIAVGTGLAVRTYRTREL